jgi:3-oxoacyl-[acyl-carrier-protein] synthase-3
LLPKEHYIYQEGQSVFKFAVVGMADVAYELLQRNNMTGDDIAWLVPHQANKRIIDATANRIGIPSEKVMLNIMRYGNTTSGTIPFVLLGMGESIEKRRQPCSCGFWRRFYLGSTLVYSKLISPCSR